MKKRILVVDDSPFFLKILIDLLSDDFIVETADSGERALDLIESSEAKNSSSFDLVVTDLEMPGLSGYDVARFVKGKNRQNKFLPVVMLTEKEITKEDAREYGCATYIPKSNLKKVVSMAKILFAANAGPSSHQNYHV